MISLRSHGLLDRPSALVLQFEAPQDPADVDRYIAVFARLADWQVPFVLLSDLRGFSLDHTGEVRQNQIAKATRSAFSVRIRGLVLVTDTPTERKRLAFAKYWNIPVEVYDGPARAESAFRALHERALA